MGGLARGNYLGETRALCNVKKLQAEGRPGLAGLTGAWSFFIKSSTRRSDRQKAGLIALA
jgi:hypothetical protein